MAYFSYQYLSKATFTITSYMLVLFFSIFSKAIVNIWENGWYIIILHEHITNMYSRLRTISHFCRNIFKTLETFPYTVTYLHSTGLFYLFVIWNLFFYLIDLLTVWHAAKSGLGITRLGSIQDSTMMMMTPSNSMTLKYFKRDYFWLWCLTPKYALLLTQSVYRGKDIYVL